MGKKKNAWDYDLALKRLGELENEFDGKDDEIRLEIERELQRLAKHCRVWGHLAEAEEYLEKLIDLRKMAVDRFEKKKRAWNSGSSSTRKQKYEEALLNLAESYFALGNVIRVQVSGRGGRIYSPETDRREKQDTYTKETKVLYNDAGVQKNLKKLLRSRVSKAEDFLVRALDIRSELLEGATEKCKLHNDTSVTQDDRVNTYRKLVAQSLSSLSILQSTYGLKAAESAHKKALNLYACSETIHSAGKDWVFDPEHDSWYSLAEKKYETEIVERSPTSTAAEETSSVASLMRRQQQQHHHQQRHHQTSPPSGIRKAFACLLPGKIDRGKRGERTGAKIDSVISSFGEEIVEENGDDDDDDDDDDKNGTEKSQMKMSVWRLKLVSKSSLDRSIPSEILLDPGVGLTIHLGSQNRKGKLPGFVGLGEDKSISKVHALLQYQQDFGAWMIRDQANRTSYGILLNNIRIRNALLKEGDHLSIGGVDMLRFGEMDVQDLTRSTSFKYRCERVLEYSSKTLVPRELFAQFPQTLKNKDLAYIHFHAMVVGEYMRQSRFTTPNKFAMGITPQETKIMYRNMCASKIPVQYWSSYIGMIVKLGLCDDFVHYYRWKELHYFGIK